MIKVFYLFKLQVKFDGDEILEVWIQCTCCNKCFHCHISYIKHGNFIKKQILPVFIKYVVFNHVGLSWMIEMEEKYYFAVDGHDEEWCTGGPWFNGTIC